MNKLIVLFAAIILSLVSGCGSYMGAQNPYMSAPMPMYGGMTAPLAQNEAFLGTPVRTCASGPLAVEIKNETDDQFVQLQIDGDDAMVIGRRGPLPPMVPPHTSVYVCLESLGLHAITGTRYVGRVGQLIPAGTLNATIGFGAVYNGNVGHHVVFIGTNDVRNG